MPKTKKSKDASSSSDSDSGPEDRNPVPSKKQKGDDSSSSSLKKADAEEPTWVLDRMRHVKVREFKGRIYIDIREYYEKDGKEMPGKKGISLSAAQYQKLKSVIPEIDEELKKM